MVEWQLNGCCGTEETVFLCFYAGYVVAFFLLYSTTVLKPMRLLAVFVHEWGHASACWLTGGQVKGIEVEHNEGGVTKYVGGCRLLVIPAGYVGGAFWGAFFTTLSGSRIGATVVCSVMTCALLGSLCYKPNSLVVAIVIAFSAINLAFIFVEWYAFSPIIEFLALFYGVFIGFYSVRDIYDDLITRTAEGSDAVACSQVLPFCHPRCVGVQFWIVAFAFQALGLYLALVWMVSNDVE